MCAAWGMTLDPVGWLFGWYLAVDKASSCVICRRSDGYLSPTSRRAFA
jgi:hypothetical protein